jgi:hypothetical protein
MGEEGKKAKDFALFIICVFSFSIVIMGVSAAIIAEYGANKIAIAHLALVRSINIYNPPSFFPLNIYIYLLSNFC